MRSLGIALACLALALSRAAGAQSPRANLPPISVGILREDSVLIPFARFNGRTWIRGWPDAVDRLDVVPELRHLPAAWWAGGQPALRWEALKLDGTRRLVTVRETTAYEADYGAGVGLRTDYVTSLPFDRRSSSQEQRATSGAVSTRRNVLRPVLPAERTAGELREITDLLPDVFRRFEPAVWGRDSFTAEVLAAHKRPQPIVRDAYVAPLPGGRRIIAVRALNSVRLLGVTALTAWFVAEANSRWTFVHADGYASDGDGKGEMVLVPLATLTEAGRTFWIAKQCAYEGGRFVVLEVGGLKPSVAATMDVAGC